MSKKKITGVTVSQPITTDVDTVLINQNEVYTNSTDNISGTYTKTFGVPNKVWTEGGWGMVNMNPPSSSPQTDLKLDASQVKLLKTVVEFLDETSAILSTRKFISNSAKDLASQISNKFHIG